MNLKPRVSSRERSRTPTRVQPPTDPTKVDLSNLQRRWLNAEFQQTLQLKKGTYEEFETASMKSWQNNDKVGKAFVSNLDRLCKELNTDAVKTKITIPKPKKERLQYLWRLLIHAEA